MPDGWAAGWQAVVPAVQVALGLVLLLSALAKLRDPPALVAGALRYQLLSPTIVRPAATLLPFAELALAVVPLFGIACRAAALVPHLDRLARSRRDIPVIAVVLPGEGLDYGHRLTASITVIRDDTGGAQKDFAVARTPLVFTIAPDGTIATRTVSNDLIALEDTLDGFGQPQGSRPWVPAEEQGNEM